jgi:thiol-disulfide isomerase/thioredoxin
MRWFLSYSIAWLLPVVLTSATVQAASPPVYSIQGLDCGSCGPRIAATVKKIPGVKKATFDIYTVELTVIAADKVTDAQVLEAVTRAEKGAHAVVGPGQGAYLPVEKYPEGSDVAILSSDGAAIGALEKLVVPGKYTVFDAYADWCGPCRTVDGKLREIVATRPDVAVRKLNVVRFDSPLAKEFGARLTALPHVVVFSPSGVRTDITGLDLAKLTKALGS